MAREIQERVYHDAALSSMLSKNAAKYGAIEMAKAMQAQEQSRIDQLEQALKDIKNRLNQIPGCWNDELTLYHIQMLVIPQAVEIIDKALAYVEGA